MNQDINNIESAGSVDVYGARVHNLKNIDVTTPQLIECDYRIKWQR